MLPAEPPTFREPTAAERPWRWLLLDADGAEAPVGPPVQDDEVPPTGRRFPARGDAETWLGTAWRDLRAAGIARVVLLDGEREVSGLLLPAGD
ncbi:hypothetical protein [Nocardioides sp. GY 10127]|uniref:hypothetical protein n=1 Tax=Nocardioides sp. GY 10127 TaxID=2569762 RepID=UPI0010A949C9|nr:hypothetical protein [Nocardioides sp. GY 10127]TIC85579.1 hypothetical protein E8D37_02860 [Nocardioides sp. GY 10127]